MEEMVWRHSFLQFLEVVHLVEENYFHIWNPDEFWVKTYDFLCKNIDQNLTLFDLTLTWPPSKIKLDEVSGSNGHHYWYLPTTWSSKHMSHGIPRKELISLVAFCDLTLTLTLASMIFTSFSTFIRYIPSLWVPSYNHVISLWPV